MTDYGLGIVFGTGYIAEENKKKYAVVRNLDSYYAKTLEKETAYRAYESKNKINRDGKAQWCIKIRNISELPLYLEIENKQDFIRAYMELHAMLDLRNAKDRRGNQIKRLRLRIFGNEKIISWINNTLPAKTKKVQHIKNIVDSHYIGETCCIYYQSEPEILNILKWIDGKPKNENVWLKWEDIVESKKTGADIVFHE